MHALAQKTNIEQAEVRVSHHPCFDMAKGNRVEADLEDIIVARCERELRGRRG